MHSLLQRLAPAGVLAKSAEELSARWYRRWLSRKLSRDPWHLVSNAGNPQRLRMETARRVARRQTGNERSYADLLKFVDDMRLFAPAIGGPLNAEKLVQALLAFPIDEAFADRIFEIWCLREIASAFQRLGAITVRGPLPLTLNRQAPIYTFRLGWDEFEVYFQRALDGATARWIYDKSEAPLRGIPDITVIANKKHYLVVDAKNRQVTGSTRPEETYKVLGYFENFRHLLDGPTCWGLLCFVSENGYSQSLTSADYRRVLLTSAHASSPADCSFADQIDAALGAWTKAIA
jgi:hypothetical protein